ncbi:LuxR C-terminal-related transcriptional regulator, partial [Kitasatospora sp. NPDC058263]
VRLSHGCPGDPRLDVVTGPHVVSGRPCPCCGDRIDLDAERHRVLTMIAAGLSNPEIATGAGISEVGVRRRIFSLYQGLGAAARVQAVDIGCRVGLLAPIPGILPPEEGITGRMLWIVELRARGLTVQGIAKRLYLSENTIKTDLFQLGRRLGMGGSVRAVHALHSLDLLPGGHPCRCVDDRQGRAAGVRLRQPSSASRQGPGRAGRS